MSIGMIVILAVLIMMSAYFSATETAFSSFNKIRMKNLATSGDKRAQLVLKLAEDYDKLLSTILIGNNIVNIASASLATVIFVEYFGEPGVTLSTIFMTIIVLIFGEISPKSLAKEAPEKFTMLSAPIIKMCICVLIPANFFFGQWKKFLSLFFKVKEETGITEEELLTIIEEAEQVGGINQQEGELIRSAIEFNDLEVQHIFIPRVDVIAVSEDASEEEVTQLFKETEYSRLPVYRETVDQIIGIIHQKDFYNHENIPFNIKSILKESLFVTSTMKISSLLKILQQNKSHMAIVVDEYGGTEGIVTLEDILEELVGEIWDEHDEIIEEIKQLSETSYRVIGNINLNKVFSLFDMTTDEENATLSGWIMDTLGKIPEEGDTFSYEKLQLKIAKTEYKRIKEVIIEEAA